MNNNNSYMDSLANNGRLNYTPPLVSVEQSSSSILLIDSSDRSNNQTDPFNFTIDLQSSIPRARFVRLKKVILPKINNVNNGNNTFVIKTTLGTTGIITLQTGMYNTTSIANELVSKINAGYVAAGIVDTVTVSFDSITRSFSITSVGSVSFFIEETSDFIVYGDNLIPFESEPLANVPSKNTIYSGPAAMLSTRYFIVRSTLMSEYQFGRSIISSKNRQMSNVIAIIDVSGIYSPADWDISSPFKGIYVSLNTDSEYISVQNPQDLLTQYLDFSIYDGYKRELSTLYNLASPPHPSQNKLSIVMVFEVIY